MWIMRFLYCLVEGHALIDVTTSRRPYQFCLRCGKVKEPVAVLVNRSIRSCALVRIRVDRDER